MSGILATDSPRRQLTARQADTVRRLTEAGVEEVRRSGYENLSIRDVARRAGVAAATAYTYFGSKDHLLTEIFWRRLNALPAAGPGTPEAKLLELAYYGAMVEAGLGYTTYEQMADRLAEAAELIMD